MAQYTSDLFYHKQYIDEDSFFISWADAIVRGERFFFVDCSYELIKQRFIKHSEDDLDIKDWKDHRRVFYDVLKHASEQYDIEVNRIDTTKDTVKQSAAKIMEKL